jgi:hypothetical protein
MKREEKRQRAAVLTHLLLGLLARPSPSLLPSPCFNFRGTPPHARPIPLRRDSALLQPLAHCIRGIFITFVRDTFRLANEYYL